MESIVYKAPLDERNYPARVGEGSSCIIEFKIIDPTNGNGVPISAVTTAVATIYDEATGAIIPIASQNEINVKEFIDSNGKLSYVLAGSYNRVLDDDAANKLEVHWMMFTINFNAGGSQEHTLVFDYKIPVERNKYHISTYDLVVERKMHFEIL